MSYATYFSILTLETFFKKCLFKNLNYHHHTSLMFLFEKINWLFFIFWMEGERDDFTKNISLVFEVFYGSNYTVCILYALGFEQLEKENEKERFLYEYKFSCPMSIHFHTPHNHILRLEIQFSDLESLANAAA